MRPPIDANAAMQVDFDAWQKTRRESECAVNHPSHYNTGKIEVIDAIDDWGCDFVEGNIIKYVARWKHKDGLRDLQKAAWYLNRLIEREAKNVATG